MTPLNFLKISSWLELVAPSMRRLTTSNPRPSRLSPPVLGCFLDNECFDDGPSDPRSMKSEIPRVTSETTRYL